ncbi:phosphoribosylanthranilate isomerase [Bradyrhizobium sp. USDA 377]
MLTQIYEISTPEEASALSAIGVDHIGVLVGDGQFPRELPISAASKIGAAIVPPSKFSALFLTHDLSLIASWARELNPAIVHLGASAELLSPQDVASLKRMLPGTVVMRSIPVFSEESVAIAQSYVGIADFLLLDSYRSTDKQIGALGVTHDWNISRRIVDLVRVPVVLAGGLGPDNVAGAIRTVRPAGVDSKTKTDQDGSHAKDLERVRRFHEAARATANNRFPSA